MSDHAQPSPTQTEKQAEELILLLSSIGSSLEAVELVKDSLENLAETQAMFARKRKFVHRQTVDFVAGCLRSLFKGDIDPSAARRLVSDAWPNAPEIPPRGDALAGRLRLLASACRLMEVGEKKKRERREPSDEENAFNEL